MKMIEVYNTVLLFPILYVFSRSNRVFKYISSIFLYSFFTANPVKSLPDIPKYQSEKERYICEYTKKYLSLFDVDPMGKIYNSNILSVFYLRKELTELLADANNTIEKTWRTRVLIETTPYGMVIMYYDAFKEGFSYYSNQTGIPYDIMNAVVMKYVGMFRCRDFFIDETVNTGKRVSPLLHSLKIEEKKEQRKKRDAAMKLNKGVKIGMGGDMPFVKFRRNSTPSITAKNTQANKCISNSVLIDKTSDDETRKESSGNGNNIVYKNKIIFLGKIANYNFLIPVNDTHRSKKPVVKIKDLKNNMFFTNMFSINDYICNTVKEKETDKPEIKNTINYDADIDSSRSSGSNGDRDGDESDAYFFTESGGVENSMPFSIPECNNSYKSKFECDRLPESAKIDVDVCGENCGYDERKNGNFENEDKTSYAYYKKNKQKIENTNYVAV